MDSKSQGGSADAALVWWYFEVPRFLGGSRAKAEEHLRRTLGLNPDSRVALTYLAEVLVAEGRVGEARPLLQRVADAPVDPDWIPEDNEFRKRALENLHKLDR